MKICDKEYRWTTARVFGKRHAAFVEYETAFCGVRVFRPMATDSENMFPDRIRCKKCLKIIEKESKS